MITPENRDHFVIENGVRFAGTHLLVDLWQAEHLRELEYLSETLRRAAVESGATVLKIDLHQFEITGGVSGVAILAESHISIHTWPEHGYAAVDVFMCGATTPRRSVEVLTHRLASANVQVSVHKRGLRSVDVPPAQPSRSGFRDAI